jgi:type I restriction enzyme M protein
MTPAAIVSILWNYCNVLRDDGMSYGDYSFDMFGAPE